MKQRFSELLEKMVNIEMTLKTARKKYDDKFSAKRNLEREISFLKNSSKEHDITIKLMQPLNRNPHQKPWWEG